MQTIKRLLLSALLLAVLVGVSQADVFGLKKGMTLEQVRALGFGELKKQDSLSEGAWVVMNPKRPKDAAAMFFLFVPNQGLLKVAISWEIETTANGYDVKKKFGELKTILSEKYGKGETYDYLMPRSMWNAPEYWMRSLLAKDRTLAWTLTDSIAESDQNKLATIGLETNAISGSKGMVVLSYEFQGWSEHVKKEASEF